MVFFLDSTECEPISSGFVGAESGYNRTYRVSLSPTHAQSSYSKGLHHSLFAVFPSLPLYAEWWPQLTWSCSQFDLRHYSITRESEFKDLCSEGETAAEVRTRMDILNYLLQEAPAAQFKAVDINQCTPLHVAAECGNCEVIQCAHSSMSSHQCMIRP
jgi:hypothetical protein